MPMMASERVESTVREACMTEIDVRDPIRVIVADDHALFRRGLFMVLEGESDIEVVAEANDGDEVVRMAEEHVPDLVLMDVRMPGKGGIEATKEIKDAVPNAKI